MLEIIIVSGFLGSGKTTFINHLIKKLPQNKVVIENEFGDVSIDSTLIDKTLPVREIYSGCVCCSLRGELSSGILKIKEEMNPEIIIIEPSGIAKLSSIKDICKQITDINPDIKIKYAVTLIETELFEEYIEDFGDFYKDQIKYSDLIIFCGNDEACKENNQKNYNDQKERINSIERAVSEINSNLFICKEDYRKFSAEQLTDLLNYTELNSKNELSFVIENQSKVTNSFFTSMTVENVIYGSEKEASDSIKEFFKNDLNNKLGYLLRIKGYISINKSLHLVNATRAVCNINKLEEYKADRLNNSKNIVTSLVIIGINLNKQAIKNKLNCKQNDKHYNRQIGKYTSLRKFRDYYDYQVVRNFLDFKSYNKKLAKITVKDSIDSRNDFYIDDEPKELELKKIDEREKI